MARITIENKWWTDPRRFDLMEKVGLVADAVAVQAWRLAQEYWADGRKSVPLNVFKFLKHSEDFVSAGLAQVDGENVHVRGTLEYLDWIAARREAGSLGGKTAKSKQTQANVSKRKQPQAKVSKDKQTQPSYSYSSSEEEEEYNIAQSGIERVYKNYPRQEGKARGIKIAKREVKTLAQLADLEKAIEAYAEHCAVNHTELRFVKHFATFMGEWRDWLDPNHAKAPSQNSTNRSL